MIGSEPVSQRLVQSLKETLEEFLATNSHARRTGARFGTEAPGPCLSSYRPPLPARRRRSPPVVETGPSDDPTFSRIGESVPWYLIPCQSTQVYISWLGLLPKLYAVAAPDFGHALHRPPEISQGTFCPRLVGSTWRTGWTTTRLAAIVPQTDWSE
jgi:hypothetical protein